MKAQEFALLLDEEAIDEMHQTYQRRGVLFGPGFDYALEKATAGIRDPKAKEIVSTVVKHLWDYLLDELESRLPQPKTRLGRWVRWVVSVLGVL